MAGTKKKKILIIKSLEQIDLIWQKSGREKDWNVNINEKWNKIKVS